jgi:hypothetical protein
MSGGDRSLMITGAMVEPRISPSVQTTTVNA